MQFASEQKIDLSDADKVEWDGYGWQGRWHGWVLKQMHALPCHVIVIGHETIYEKFKGKGQNRILVSTHTQPLSVSGPHGGTLGKDFSDIFRFTRLSEAAYKINTGGDDFVMGGSRHFPGQQFDWNAFGPDKVLAALGAKSTGQAREAFIYKAPGEAASPMSASPVLAQVSAAPAQNAAPASPQVIGSGLSTIERLRLAKSPS